jgi:hypothetical protein
MTYLRGSGTPAHRTEPARYNLSVGLHAVTEINQTIRYADTKSAALAGIQALAVTILVARRDAGTGGPLPVLLFASCLACVMISAGLLAAGQVPRLTSARPPEGPNRIAFPSLATMRRSDVLTTPTLKAQQEDVWRQAADLATIAVTKYRWLHSAMVSTLATFATVLLWLGTTTWLG